MSIPPNIGTPQIDQVQISVVEYAELKRKAESHQALVDALKEARERIDEIGYSGSDERLLGKIDAALLGAKT